MRSLAEDIRGGQIEVVLAQPLSELELLLGKYLASVLFLWIALALALPIPLALSLGAAMPWPTVIAQYIGAGLLAAGFAGIGTWASSLSRSQITRCDALQGRLPRRLTCLPSRSPFPQAC